MLIVLIYVFTRIFGYPLVLGIHSIALKIAIQKEGVDEQIAELVRSMHASHLPLTPRICSLSNLSIS